MTMITPSYLGETIEYSSLHACRSTLEDPTDAPIRDIQQTSVTPPCLDSGRSRSKRIRKVPFKWIGEPGTARLTA